MATTDTFGGNSGSGVYLADTGEVAGILVRGETDYVLDSNLNCYHVNYCSETGCSGEDSTYVFRAIDALCKVASSARLCGPYCGDLKCQTGETVATCPSDCKPVPSEWKCDNALYGTGDGCHCNCGAFDPDCSVAPLPAFNCRKNMVCNSSGVCVR